MHPPIEDLLLLVVLLQCLQQELDGVISNLRSMLAAHISHQRRLNRNLPADEARVTWDNFCSKVSEQHFRRMFRMTICMFDGLCGMIETKIGEETFRSERFSFQKFDGKPCTGTAPSISGQVKVALSIRMLAGGSHLDLVPLFDVSGGHICATFQDFLRWVKQTLSFPLSSILREERMQALEELANDFAEKTNGVFCGPFAALDGLAVRVRSPSLQEVSDPGNYYCRKGFFAIDVQALCDRKKRFLWVFTGSKGSTHDSAAFANSRLYDLPLEMALFLHQKGLFIVGDSACGLAPFLLVPHEQTEVKQGGDPNGMKDSFNFHLSSCRIYIECAFGELVMRWGISWRTLLFDLKKSQDVVQACMLLQNFIIDNRDMSSRHEDCRCFEAFRIFMDETQTEITRQTGETPRAVVTDNNEPRRRGRPTVEEQQPREIGNKARHRMTIQLGAAGMRRPLHSDMHCNDCGHIYFN